MSDARVTDFNQFSPKMAKERSYNNLLLFQLKMIMA